jgi:mannose-6-phosphate isomerase-like protein (cupin superfamily)
VIPILEKGAKNASIACTGSATATLVDLKEPIAQHSHNDADELIYVVAGEGTQRIGNVETRLDAGTLAAVPRGTPHNIARRGSRQFVYISILTGPPCTSPAK